jgi:SAM-dependent methyltransferase
MTRQDAERCNHLIAAPAQTDMSTSVYAPAYDALAPAYDLLTAAYRYDRWLAGLERLAREHGLTGRRVLDVACGTGHSFLPLLARGYEVSACDVSPEMVARAAAKAGGAARLEVADMRALPCLGSFDLITCLGDSMNHLVEPDDVADAFDGMRRNLAPGGLIVFDVNTFAAYRTIGDSTAADDDVVVVWRGSLARLEAPAGSTEVVVETFSRRDDDLWERRTARHPHRHYPLAEIHELLARAGLRPLAVRGQRPGAHLEETLDEDVHHKAVLVATHDEGGF